MLRANLPRSASAALSAVSINSTSIKASNDTASLSLLARQRRIVAQWMMLGVQQRNGRDVTASTAPAPSSRASQEEAGWFSPDMLRHVLGREAHDLLGGPAQLERMAQHLQHRSPREDRCTRGRQCDEWAPCLDGRRRETDLRFGGRKIAVSLAGTCTESVYVSGARRGKLTVAPST